MSSVASGIPFLVEQIGGGELVVSYEDVSGVGGYHVYEGALGSWYSHAGNPNNLCTAYSTLAAGGRRETVVAPTPGDRYFLVSAYTTLEGPSGFATSGEIPPSDSTCAP